MRVFDFDHAIARAPGASVVDGIRSDPRRMPAYAAIAAEHASYVAALRSVGLWVEVLSPLELYPDSIFVEDPALVFPEGAILLRPGAKSRTGEAEHLRTTLAQHFGEVAALGEGECADGGDVLVTPQTVFIGLSRRTNQKGAQALKAMLASFGRKAAIVETPAGVLHLKSACALLDEETIVATPALAASGVFHGFRIVVIQEGEEPAANLVRINDFVLADNRFPRTIEHLTKEGHAIVPLALSEIAKLDAGLSCMSLRWRKKQHALT